MVKLSLILIVAILFTGTNSIQGLELEYSRLYYEIDDNYNIYLLIGLDWQGFIYQAGGHNLFLFYQEDDDNYFKINQDGENNRAALIQQGSGNTAVINQSGSNNKEADDNE